MNYFQFKKDVSDYIRNCKHLSYREKNQAISFVLNPERYKYEVGYLLKRIDNLKTYGRKPLKDKLCPRCHKPLRLETEMDIDYMYVCDNCDENFYEFEVK